MPIDDQQSTQVILDLSRLIERMDAMELRLSKLSRSVDALRELVRITRRERAEGTWGREEA